MTGFSIFCAAITAFICLALPTILALVLIIKHKASWKAFVLGIAVFSIFQIFTRLPLLNYLQFNAPWFVLFQSTNPIAYILVLAFTAGLFEECGRFVGMRFFMKKDLSWKNGIVFGLGHGGIEAFVLVGIPVLLGVMMGDSSVTGADPTAFILSGIERALAVTLQVGMSLIVLYSVKFKKVRFLLLAILFHMAVDSGYLLNLAFGPNPWIMEGYVAAFTVLAVLIIVKIRPILNKNEILDIKWRF